MRIPSPMLVVVFVWLAAVPVVIAGPNAGGVLVVHSSTVANTSDQSTYIGGSGIACGQDGPSYAPECPPYDPVDGSVPCTIADANPTSTRPANAPQVWYVLAAFAELTCPRLKAVGFGFQYDERWTPGNPNGRIVIIASGSADPLDPALVFDAPEGAGTMTGPSPRPARAWPSPSPSSAPVTCRSSTGSLDTHTAAAGHSS